MAEAERWDRVYASEPHLLTTAPNALLMATAGAMPAGRALDIGMGQGRNAAWLAEQRLGCHRPGCVGRRRAPGR